MLSSNPSANRISVLLGAREMIRRGSLLMVTFLPRSSVIVTGKTGVSATSGLAGVAGVADGDGDGSGTGDGEIGDLDVSVGLVTGGGGIVAVTAGVTSGGGVMVAGGLTTAADGVGGNGGLAGVHPGMINSPEITSNISRRLKRLVSFLIE